MFYSFEINYNVINRKKMENQKEMRDHSILLHSILNLFFPFCTVCTVTLTHHLCLCSNLAVIVILMLFVEMSVATTVVAIIGKGFSSASFATLVLYSSELYPTVVR